MILYLNTIDKIAEIRLYDDKFKLIDELSFDGSFILSEELVRKIDFLLKNNNLSKKDLTQIAVNIGPGSYTGVRIGVTTANSIAFALNLPIIEISDEKDVEKVITKRLTQNVFSSPALPVYSHSPHITKKKVD